MHRKPVQLFPLQIKEDALTRQTRPGNLIIGGGGRGIRRAPKALGMGEWEIMKGHDDPVGKVYIRKSPSLEKRMDKDIREG